jgi:hypothetical protein
MILPSDPGVYEHQSYAHTYPPPEVPAPGFLLHCMAAIGGGGFCAAFAGVLLVRAIGFHSASSNSNLLMWYSPLIWWAGPLLGYLSNRRTRSTAGCYAWVPGTFLLGFLALDLFWTNHSWDRTLVDLFPLRHGQHCPDDELGLYQLFFIWPAINSFAYSLGASIPLVFGRRIDDGHSIANPPSDSRR